MQKLSYSIINRILEESLTGTEIDLLVYIARYQDDTGHICGVYYKDIVRATFHHKTQIYKAVKTLEEKGFIRREKNSRYDMDITICNNDLSLKDFRKGYLRVNKKIFLNGEFFKMKAREKIMALQFLKNCDSAPNGTFRKRKTEFMEWYKEKLGVLERSIGRYLTVLKQYFNIYLKNGIYYIKCLKNKTEGDKEYPVPSDRDMIYSGEVNKALRRNRLEGSMAEKEELKTIMQQYSDINQMVTVDLTKAIRESLAKQTEKRVNIKLIHKIVRQLLGISQA